MATVCKQIICHRNWSSPSFLIWRAGAWWEAKIFISKCVAFNRNKTWVENKRMCSFWPIWTDLSHCVQTYGLLWVIAFGPSEVNSPSQHCRVSEPEKLVSLYQLQSLFWDDLTWAAHPRKRPLFQTCQNSSQSNFFCTDVRLLISCTLTFPPSLCLPRSQAPPPQASATWV